MLIVSGSRRAVVAVLTVILGLASPWPVETAGASSGGPSNLERAYSHNDYNQDRDRRDGRRHALYDALDNRFKGVEADICLRNGDLLVAHSCGGHLDSHRTLRSLYLEPLLRRVIDDGGAVYRGDGDYFTLLIDIKSADSVATYQELDRELRGYAQMLTAFDFQGIRDGAVTVMVSGKQPRPDLTQGAPIRFAAYDGLFAGLGLHVPQAFVPMVSQNWTTSFVWQGQEITLGWDGHGAMPKQQRETLRFVVQVAHADGQRVRFYETPQSRKHPEAMCRVWQELLDARVDYINTDHLTTLRRFLALSDPQPTVPWVSWGAPPPLPSDEPPVNRLAERVRTEYPCGSSVRAAEHLGDGSWVVHLTTAAGTRIVLRLDRDYRVTSRRRE